VAEPIDAKADQKVRLINYIFPIAILVLLVGGYLFFTNQSTTGKAVTPVGDQNISAKGAVLFFYSDTCPHCIAEEPIVQRLMNESYNIVWENVAYHADEAIKLGVTATPTFVASNGDKKEGEVSYDELKAWLDQHGAKTL
jgi:thiol-disulfide isomerase/thioredoxin